MPTSPATIDRCCPAELFRTYQDVSPDNFSLWEPVRAPDGTVDDFVLSYANAALRRAFGVGEEMIGRPMSEIFPSARASGRFARYVRVLETGRASDTIVEYEVDGRSLRLSVVHVGGHLALTSTDVTAQVEAERVLRRSREELEQLVAERAEALRESEERFRSLTEHASDPITILDAEGMMRYGSRAYERVFGYRLDEILGTSVFSLVHPDDRDDVSAVFRRIVEDPTATRSAEFRIYRPDGAIAWVQATGQNRLADPAVRGIVVNSRDVTEQRLAADAMRRAEAMFRGLAQQSLTGSYIGQDGRLVYGSPRFAEIFGYEVHEVLAVPELLQLIAPEERTRVAEHIGQRLSGGVDQQYVTMGLRRDGTRVPIEIYGSTIELDGRPAVVATVLDISARVHAEATLRDLAVRDELTGLLNRRGFRQLAEQHMRTARRESRPDALLFLDLSGFKEINDRFGHAAGDAALCSVADLLRRGVREGDLVARLGGDEFVIYAVGAGAPVASALATRLRRLLEQENASAQAAGRRFAIRTGIGVAQRHSADDLDGWLARADAALYANKTAAHIEARARRVSGIVRRAAAS